MMNSSSSPLLHKNREIKWTKFSFIILLYVNFVVNFAFFIGYPSLWPYVKEVVPTSWSKKKIDTVYGVCVAVFSATFAVSSLIQPYIVRKLNYKLTFCKLNLIGLIGNIIYAFAALSTAKYAVWLIFVARVLIGYSAGSISISIMLIVQITATSERLNGILSIALSQISGSIAGPGIFFGLAYVNFKVFKYKIDSNNSPGFISSILYIIAQFLLIWFYNPTANLASEAKSMQPRMKISTFLTLLVLCLDMFVLFTVYSGIESVIVPLAEGYFKWGLKESAAMFFGLGAIALFDFLLMRYVLYRIPDRILLIISLCFLLAGTILLNDMKHLPLSLPRFLSGN
eukprot:TRINITY_DN5729_c0_g1_i6.p1 TRINITY_DN5729_c0_g1~~TRINITY_DN5729_c0_g1_i6.p1  ORF type:complete len:341 (-),score=18.43 TRINITY_DN5729_c0_g1_i6:309-1331(-)